LNIYDFKLENNKKKRCVGLRLSHGETEIGCAREYLLVHNNWSSYSVIFFCPILWQELKVKNN